MSWPGGLPGDQVKLVAFDVGEGRPPVLTGLQVAEPAGAQAQQALGLGPEGVADEVEVEAVLDDFRFRDLVEYETWLADVPAAGEQHRPLGRAACRNLPPKDIGPELGQGRGVGAVNGDCE